MNASFTFGLWPSTLTVKVCAPRDVFPKPASSATPVTTTAMTPHLRAQPLACTCSSFVAPSNRPGRHTNSAAIAQDPSEIEVVVLLSSLQLALSRPQSGQHRQHDHEEHGHEEGHREPHRARRCQEECTRAAVVPARAHD